MDEETGGRGVGLKTGTKDIIVVQFVCDLAVARLLINPLHPALSLVQS